ncbi:unnamed protein product [Caenorhabditis auriculariae]|uniref:Uncharacterized protein n=1 Tax=Caenorhabditis auriculariae TaxID=2777116 RepID=A0A8S1H874_9PELO|nr:unnamed protein product [Caenorhabditis auriculariae]
MTRGPKRLMTYLRRVKVNQTDRDATRIASSCPKYRYSGRERHGGSRRLFVLRRSLLPRDPNSKNKEKVRSGASPNQKHGNNKPLRNESLPTSSFFGGYRIRSVTTFRSLSIKLYQISGDTAMLLLRSLALTCVLILAVAGQDLSCRDPQFLACQYTLAQQVGLNDTVSSQLFKDYTIMYNYFLYMYGRNPGTTADMVQVCNALETFNACMYGNRGCLDISNLLKKTDLINAYFSDGTMAQYAGFNCGPGVNTLLHEGLGCAQRVMKNYQNTLIGCINSYQSSVTHDAKNGCTYVDSLIKCWSAPFSTSPCRRTNSADVWWACESNRVFSLNQFPNCGNTCDLVRGPFMTSEYLDTHHKVVDGVHHYKIPDYVTKIDGKLVTVEGKWMSD